MIDYDNSTFKEIWEYEFEEGLEERKIGNRHKWNLTGKFINESGNVIYYTREGEYHREDGPSFIYRTAVSSCTWHNNGKEHRIDGPAIYFFDDKNKRKQFWIFGNPVSESDFLIFSNLGNGNEVILL
ncbi:MAG: hypothetical protein ACOCV1_03140 [Bacillota bacterium]